MTTGNVNATPICPARDRGREGFNLGSVPAALRHSLPIGQGPKTAALLLLPFLSVPLRSRWIVPAALLLAARLVSADPAYWVGVPRRLDSGL